MERLKLDCMTIWDLELIMKIPVAGAQQWHIVLMVQG